MMGGGALVAIVLAMAPSDLISGPEVTEHRPGGGMTLPVLVERVEPHYPSSVWIRSGQGRVTLRAVVRADGTVGDITVVASDHDAFTKAAIAAVEKWRYTPALLDGRPIDLYYTIVVRFAIDGVLPAAPSPRACYGDDAEGPTDPVDEPPRPEWKEPVVLPERLESSGGEVEVEFEVCRDGRVRSVNVLRASDPSLVEAAGNAARRWRFSPALRAGRPVAAWHKALLKIRPRSR